jgi:hypothetical protein
VYLIDKYLKIRYTIINKIYGKEGYKMKKATKNILRIVISILYIVWGIYAPVSAIQAILAFNIPALISAAVGVLMLLAGISGLIGLRKIKCRILGIVIFVFALVGVVTALPAIAVNSIISAILAWLFIACM